ncbi:MAG: preQ(1) synthase [Candidatus Omnitrophota bacterium]
MAKRKNKGSTYEGLQKNVRTLTTPAIEAWKNPYADKDYVITIDFPEFTCLCPKTGQPDFATITIRYIPDKWCLELKSLKFYYFWFRQVGIFNENVVNRVLDDIVKACKPRWAEATGDFNQRGGMKTVVRREYRESARPR